MPSRMQPSPVLLYLVVATTPDPSKPAGLLMMPESVRQADIDSLGPSAWATAPATTFLMVAACLGVCPHVTAPFRAVPRARDDVTGLTFPQYRLPKSRLTVGVLPSQYGSWVQQQMNLALVQVFSSMHWLT